MPMLARWVGGAALVTLLLALFLTLRSDGEDTARALSPAETVDVAASASTDLASPLLAGAEAATGLARSAAPDARVELGPRTSAATDEPIVLHGVSIDRDGVQTPLAGGRVEYTVTEAGDDEPEWRSGVTDAGGRFTFPQGTQLGEYRLRAPGHLGEDRVYDPERHGRKLWLHLDQLAELRVEVVGPDGARRVGVPVRLARPGAEDRSNSLEKCLLDASPSVGDGLLSMTDQNAQARWTGIAPGAVMELRIEDPEHGEQVSRVQPFKKGESREVRVELETGRWISFLALDQHGDPLDGAQLTVTTIRRVSIFEGAGTALGARDFRSRTQRNEIVRARRRNPLARSEGTSERMTWRGGALALEAEPKPLAPGEAGLESPVEWRSTVRQVITDDSGRADIEEFVSGPMTVELHARAEESGDLYFGGFRIDASDREADAVIELQCGPHFAELSYSVASRAGTTDEDGGPPWVEFDLRGPASQVMPGGSTLNPASVMRAPVGSPVRLWVNEPGTYVQRSRLRTESPLLLDDMFGLLEAKEFTVPGSCHTEH